MLGVLAILLFATRRSGNLAKLNSPEVLPNIAFLLVYSAVLIFDISYYELKGINTDRVHIIMLPRFADRVIHCGDAIAEGGKGKAGGLSGLWACHPAVLGLVQLSHQQGG